MTAPAPRMVGPIAALPVKVLLGYYPEDASANVDRWSIAKWGTSGGGMWEGPAPLEDITCNVISVKLQRGRDQPLERFRPSTATVEVYDPDGRWSPWRTADVPSQYGAIRPGIDIQIAYDDPPGTTWYRFVGLVDSIVDTFPEPTIGDSHHVVFGCVDRLSLLAAYDGVEQSPAGDGELAGARLSRILNNAAYTGPRNFDAGTVGCELQPTTLAKNALDEAGITTDTEMGALWCDRTGTLQFRDRNGLVSDPHYTTVQATFGEVAPEICYSDLDLTSDLDKIKNIVSVANVGGTATTISDTTSISLYQPRTYKRTDLINKTGAQNGIIAQRHLDFYAYADNRVGALKVDLTQLSLAQQRQVLGLGAQWRIQLRRRAEGFQVVADLQIQGIDEEITPTDWTINYRTFSASAVFNVGRWSVDTWGNGLWGY